MRVHGSISPEIVQVDMVYAIDGYAEVRIHENINKIGERDYEYDEYIFVVPKRDNLKADIEAHLSEWLSTGRFLEFNEDASTVQDMAKALQTLGVKTNEK